MPTTTPVVLRALVDDAAVFPPGNAPLAEAMSRHAVHRDAWYAGCVGPLLVPAASAADLVRVLDEQDAVASPRARGPVALVLVARPGADPVTLTAAWSALGDDPRVQVVGAELGWYDGWYDDLAGDLPLAVEMPRGPDGDHAFAEVRTAHREGLPVVLKFRTGPTATWTWPDEQELATFLRLVALEVPYKLTGGLHHAVRGSYEVGGVPEENHGVLNVLVATSAALAHAGQDEVAALLAVRDATALADLVAAWPDATAHRVRGAFTTYGCCTVTDPLGELADLGLLARP
ncbi:MAG TPA: hypothetical protein VES93_00325 [Ornithinibacter sp.]|nr:hypothetical protein [Ornithinibacter sp.]